MIKKCLWPWCVVWGVFYVGIMLMNYLLPGSEIVKAISCVGIGLNVLYVWKISPKDYLLQIALAFTMLADVVIAVGAPAFLCVFVFVFAQFFHFARLSGIEERYFLMFLITLTLIVYAVSLLGLEPAVAMGTFYALLLVGNIIMSVMWYRKTRTLPALMAVLGFVLFALCDVCVLTAYASRIGLIPSAILLGADFVSWIYYYPSQIFLANSSKNLKGMIQ